MLEMTGVPVAVLNFHGMGRKHCMSIEDSAGSRPLSSG